MHLLRCWLCLYAVVMHACQVTASSMSSMRTCSVRTLTRSIGSLS